MKEYNRKLDVLYEQVVEDEYILGFKIIAFALLDAAKEYGLNVDAFRGVSDAYSAISDYAEKMLYNKAKAENKEPEFYVRTFYVETINNIIGSFAKKYRIKYNITEYRFYQYLRDFLYYSRHTLEGQKYLAAGFKEWKDLHDEIERGSKEAGANLNFESFGKPALKKIPTILETTKELILVGDVPGMGTPQPLLIAPGERFNVYSWRDDSLIIKLLSTKKATGFFYATKEPGKDIPEGFRVYAYRWCEKLPSGYWVFVGKETLRKWKEYSKEVEKGSKEAGANLDF